MLKNTMAVLYLLHTTQRPFLNNRTTFAPKKKHHPFMIIQQDHPTDHD